MRVFLLFGLFLTVCANNVQYFTTPNDYLDVDALMNQPERAITDLKCFVNKGECTEELEGYKKNMPEAVSTACRRCNTPQKHMWNRFFIGMKEKYPEYYKAFQDTYDPDNIYMDAFEKSVAAF